MVRTPLLISTLLMQAIVSACRGTPDALTAGDPAPAVMQQSPRVTVVLAARLDDCLNCSLRGVFIALRALQRSETGHQIPDLVFLAIAGDPGDSAAFRRTLNAERVTGRIELVPPPVGRTLLHGTILPAMYLAADGRIARVWQPPAAGATIFIERTDLLRAVAGHTE